MPLKYTFKDLSAVKWLPIPRMQRQQPSALPFRGGYRVTLLDLGQISQHLSFVLSPFEIGLSGQ